MSKDIKDILFVRDNYMLPWRHKPKSRANSSSLQDKLIRTSQKHNEELTETLEWILNP